MGRKPKCDEDLRKEMKNIRNMLYVARQQRDCAVSVLEEIVKRAEVKDNVTRDEISKIVGESASSEVEDGEKAIGSVPGSGETADGDTTGKAGT